MSDSEIIQNIVIFDIDIEEEGDNGRLVRRTAPDEEREEEQLNQPETGTKQQEKDEEQGEKKEEQSERIEEQSEKNEEQGEKNEEEEAKVTVKPDKPDGPEKGGSERIEGSLARRRYIYRQQRRDNDAASRNREKAEEKDGEVKPKRKADNEAGEGRSGEGGSDQVPSGDAAGVKKKTKLEEPAIAEDPDKNSNSSSDSASAFCSSAL